MNVLTRGRQRFMVQRSWMEGDGSVGHLRGARSSRQATRSGTPRSGLLGRSLALTR